MNWRHAVVALGWPLVLLVLAMAWVWPLCSLVAAVGAYALLRAHQRVNRRVQAARDAVEFERLTSDLRRH